MVELTHTFCMDIHTCLTTVENNYALMVTGLREEVIAMRNELISMIGHVSQLYQSLSTPLIQLWTLIKQVDDMEERLEHVCEAIGQDLEEPTRHHDSD
ncbi:hypothetical protein CJ030_MR8G025481 [Morella rubra]|uniref:Uncharacterized protein n=1 Tax=Morella rubra TaxID=262757 RepID=A0A6A1UX94_9ROSI|nr:hypothetical protein CJ030_MR8G025481 [Morella rubra]